MNQKQKKYAYDRVRGLLDIKYRKIEEKYTTPAIKLTFDEKVKLIDKGRVKLLPRSVLRDYTDLVDAFDFSSFETEAKFNKEQMSKLKDKAQALAMKAQDEILLGDSTKALAAIREFEAFIV